jgi:molybdopterin/thiamine biosynthesis adenylyltransferase
MNRHARQSFLGDDSGEVLKKLRVAIVGLGGGGSHVVQQLSHVGVGNLFMFDFDRVEGTNLNRLVGATEADVVAGTLKTQVAKRLASGINSSINAQTFDTPWQENAAALRRCDVIFGCVDSFMQRRDLETAARRHLTPYIDIGMDVHELEGRFVIAGQVALSMPGHPCMRCLGLLPEEALAREAGQYGAAGSMPQVIWPNGVLASLAVSVLVQLVTPWHPAHENTVLLEYDGNTNTVRRSLKLDYLNRARCPHFSSLQELGDPFLE